MQTEPTSWITNEQKDKALVRLNDAKGIGVA